MIKSQTGAVTRNYKYVKLSCTKHSFSTKKNVLCFKKSY